MADCAEDVIISSDRKEDQVSKDDPTSVEKNSNLCSPPSLDLCMNSENRDNMEMDGNGEIYSEMPVITQLTEENDKNCEINSDNKNYCGEIYDNCNVDVNSTNPAEMCESTFQEEGAPSESWLMAEPVGNDSEHKEPTNQTFHTSNSKIKGDGENILPAARESSPCLLAISEIRQNEPWLSDDSSSNPAKQHLSKEEFILAESTSKKDNTVSKSESSKQPKESSSEDSKDASITQEKSPSHSSTDDGNDDKLKDKIDEPKTDDETQEKKINGQEPDNESNVETEQSATEEPMEVDDTRHSTDNESNVEKSETGESELSKVQDENNSIPPDDNSPKSVEKSQNDKVTSKKNVEEEKDKPEKERSSRIDDIAAKLGQQNQTDTSTEEKVSQNQKKSSDANSENSLEKTDTSDEKTSKDDGEKNQNESDAEMKVSQNQKKSSEANSENSSEKNDTSDEKTSKDDAEKNQKESDAEMKGYITDTMNELLGLFGYDQVDENMKDNLKIGSVSGTTKPAETTSQPPQEQTKPAEQSKKEGSNRVCAECNVTKKLKYQVLYQGKTRFLCSDSCFQVFRGKQKLTLGNKDSSAEMCAQCKKEIKNGHGYFPTGENKPLCSEECMQKYQQAHGPKQVCAQCKSSIEGRTKCLTWETMEFCNEECLGKYQTFLGSHCTCCQAAVQRPSLGKYCVRFGSDIRQFCSGRCLEEFKKGLKVCSFCQKDLSSGQEGFLAPVGDKGYFKDFCSQQCMERYEAMNSSSASPPTQQCSVCNKTAAIKVQVKYEGKSHALCSEPCIAAFRYANKINTTICDTCHKFFDSKTTQYFNLQFEGASKRFCTKSCMNLFVLSHRKIVPCTWCKVKKYNFDMIERVDSNNHVQLFCSLNCLSLFRVSLNATSSKSVRCDHCQQLLPAQYHLTMSDASIRNFCSYQCVIHFQNQFTHVPTLTTATPSVRQNTPNASGKTTTPQTPTPVISSVMSLAPTPAKQVTAATPKPVQISLSQKNRPTTSQAPPPLTVISTKPQPAISSQSTVTSVPSTSSSPQIIREVIVRPPAPKLLKNKALLCKPIMQTKGISCKPHPCHKSIQTDEFDDDIVDITGGSSDKEPRVRTRTKPVIIPVPLPMYVPVPLHMFSRPVPSPMPFPLPIPVPIFIPTTKSSSTEILKHIREIQDKIPSNPFEADLLMMAEMVAEGEKSPIEEDAVKSTEDYTIGNDCNSIGEDNNILDNSFSSHPELKEPILDLESTLFPLTSSAIVHDPENNTDAEELSPPEKYETRRARSSSKRTKAKGQRGRPRKKPRVDDETSITGADDSNSQQPPVNEIAETERCLKHTFGVNAWKHWVIEKNSQLEKGSQSLRKLKLFKTDILQLSPDELNYSLCLFVKEVRKPQGDEYAPDSIYYLCLGIQQYLFENGRIDNIFTDPYYEKFTECLNEVLQRYETLDNEFRFVSRIEEEILWEAKQLGAHSPHVLLNTLMYFNTKQFFLKTIEDHMQLSFSHIMKHWKKSPAKGGTGRTVLLRYYPPLNRDASKKRREDQPVYEQLENVDNPLRCPVKLYEFYLSKCPESVKTRNDIFYLYPERSCVPDSPVWYSTQPLGREAVSKMLQRIKMVREIHEIEDDQNG